jgi:hypothetical protein
MFVALLCARARRAGDCPPYLLMSVKAVSNSVDLWSAFKEPFPSLALHTPASPFMRFNYQFPRR